MKVRLGMLLPKGKEEDGCGSEPTQKNTRDKWMSYGRDWRPVNK